MSSVSQLYYVYVLARPNGRVFYVGKGKNNRVYQHDNEARRGHNCHKCNVIRKIWRQGGVVQRYIVFTTANEQEAFDYERELIAFYGRENLTNSTDGGEGPANPDPEVRRKMGRGSRGRPSPNRGKSPSRETRDKIAAKLRGRPLPPHVHDRFVKFNVGRTYPTEHRNNIALAQTNNRTYTALYVDGTRCEGVTNLSAFEQEHNLPKSGLHEVLIGRCAHCKGWVIWVDGNDPKPLPRRFTIISPDGISYKHIWNVAQFGADHNVSGSCLRDVLSGRRRQYKGWRGYQEDSL